MAPLSFLSIAKRLRQECDIPGTGPNTLISQIGELKRIVDWMGDAYQDIQEVHDDWIFLANEFSFPCVVGVGDYDASRHGIADLNQWRDDTFRCSLTASDEQFIDCYEWEQFRDTWKVGTQKTRTGRPICFSIKPDNSLTFDCIPDAAYTISGMYYRNPFPVGLDDEFPVLPEQFHMAIVYRAMMLYGAFSAEPDKYATGQDEYRKRLRRMESLLLPKVGYGEPLA